MEDIAASLHELVVDQLITSNTHNWYATPYGVSLGAIGDAAGGVCRQTRAHPRLEKREILGRHRCQHWTDARPSADGRPAECELVQFANSGHVAGLFLSDFNHWGTDAGPPSLDSIVSRPSKGRKAVDAGSVLLFLIFMESLRTLPCRPRWKLRSMSLECVERDAETAGVSNAAD